MILEAGGRFIPDWNLICDGVSFPPRAHLERRKSGAVSSRFVSTMTDTQPRPRCVRARIVKEPSDHHDRIPTGCELIRTCKDTSRLLAGNTKILSSHFSCPASELRTLNASLILYIGIQRFFIYFLFFEGLRVCRQGGILWF